MKKIFSLTTEKLNLIIACSAILISLASFYATYIQAGAAEKQVKAMTLPLIDFRHGDYDSSSNKQIINLSIYNSGMGAAIVKNTKLLYKGIAYDSLDSFLTACCSNQYKNYKSDLKAFNNGTKKIEGLVLVTLPIKKVVIPPQSEYPFLILPKTSARIDLYKKLNKARWKLNVEICYCTLLGDCFKSKDNISTEEVSSCEA